MENLLRSKSAEFYLRGINKQPDEWRQELIQNKGESTIDWNVFIIKLFMNKLNLAELDKPSFGYYKFISVNKEKPASSDNHHTIREKDYIFSMDTFSFEKKEGTKRHELEVGIQNGYNVLVCFSYWVASWNKFGIAKRQFDGFFRWYWNLLCKKFVY